MCMSIAKIDGITELLCIIDIETSFLLKNAWNAMREH